MWWRDQQGFTIIETSMFLAISALLFVGLIGGVSLAISRQRYSDSVQSTLSFLQKQFNETLNVVNSREADPCVPKSAPIGASSCFVMGKVIQVHPGVGASADRVDVSPVVGRELADGVESSLDGYFDQVLDEDGNGQEFLIPWGARVSAAAVVPEGGSPVSIDRIALLRSPESGATFVYAFPPGQAISGLDGAAFRVSKKRPAVLCVESQDLAGSLSAITFNGTGSQDGIRALFDQETNCGL